MTALQLVRRVWRSALPGRRSDCCGLSDCKGQISSSADKGRKSCTLNDSEYLKVYGKLSLIGYDCDSQSKSAHKMPYLTKVGLNVYWSKHKCLLKYLILFAPFALNLMSIWCAYKYSAENVAYFIFTSHSKYSEELTW